MTARITAWALVIGTVWGIAHYGGQLRNPWALSNPVLSNLPDTPQGCRERC